MEGRFDALEKQISQLIHAVEDLTAQVQSLAYVSRKDPTKVCRVPNCDECKLCGVNK